MKQNLAIGRLGDWAIGLHRPPTIQSPNRPITKSPNSPAFTLVELIVSMGVLALLMILISELFSAALAVTGMRNKQMDADAQARAVFDRMAIDFAQMVKRPDVDYFLKDPTNNPQPGNDQIAFYSQVPGYFTTGTATQQSPVSLVAYRVNGATVGPYYNQLQRYGGGLVWNGITSGTAVVFSGSSSSFSPNTITTNWPAATSKTTADANYEAVGPQVFRMEYYYVLKGAIDATGNPMPSILSDTPWDVRPPLNHTSVNGMQDVAAITMVIAVADPKSRVLINNTQLVTLAGIMDDFSTGGTPNPGDLEAQWQAAISAKTNGIAPIATQSLRVYRRTFYLSSNPPPTP